MSMHLQSYIGIVDCISVTEYSGSKIEAVGERTSHPICFISQTYQFTVLILRMIGSAARMTMYSHFTFKSSLEERATLGPWIQT